MLALIEERHAEIAAICRQYGVKRLELFGSAASGKFDPDKSDLDFFVDFLDQGWKNAADNWFGLQESLEALLKRHVDLVSIRTATNPYFLQAANEHRVALYAA